MSQITFHSQICQPPSISETIQTALSGTELPERKTYFQIRLRNHMALTLSRTLNSRRLPWKLNCGIAAKLPHIHTVVGIWKVFVFIGCHRNIRGEKL